MRRKRGREHDKKWRERDREREIEKLREAKQR